jgi:uncharacterized protein involved in copper resistance
MKKLVALVAGIAFSLGIGLAVPTFAQTPAPKEEKKGEMDKDKMDKKSDKKGAAKKKKSDKMDKDKMDKMEKKDDKK